MSKSTSGCSELQLAIFNAAKEGKLKHIKNFLASRPLDEVKALTSAKIEGSTALISAAREGHVEVVKYLITKCHTDMQQCGSVVFDGETIEDAPPLWCAAAAGHFKVVECLVQNKADPNCTTQTNSTPMRAACFDGHLGIVKYLLAHKADIEIANRHQHTCLMIACYKGHVEVVRTLLDAGANVNRCSVKRNTALHDCAENGSAPIAKLLLKYKAKMQRDSHGMSPLMTAAVAGHVPLTDYFSSLPEITPQEKIQANELLGSTFLDKRHDISMAYHFWRKALTLRRLYLEPPRPVRTLVPAYGNIREPSSLEELEASRADPEKSRMISLLIRERVLGPKHPDTSYYIRYRGAVFADAGDFEKCIALWMYALDMQREHLEPLYPMTLSSLLSFAELFSFMQQSRSHLNTTVPRANYNQIMEVLERAVNQILKGYKLMIEPKKGGETSGISLSSKTLQSRSSTSARVVCPSTPPNGSTSRHRPPHRPPPSVCCSMCEASNQRVYRAMVIALHLTALSDIVLTQNHHNCPETVSAGAEKRARILFQLRDVRDHCDRTMLHLASCSRACSLGRYPVTKFPNTDVMSILTGCGFDPNARDKDRKTPLHFAAETAKSHKNNSAAVDIMQQLLDNGSHIDHVDGNGRTVADIMGPHLTPKINPIGRQTLQCLCSRVIRKFGLDYRALIPGMLHDFVAEH